MDLEIKELHVNIEDKEIVKGVNLKIGEGEFHVIMGPNGSGKSTLAKTIMGHPRLKVTKGEILADGTDITGMSADKRAKLGIFLQFQNPIEIEGVGFVNFLHTAKRSVVQGDVDVNKFMGDIKDLTEKLKITNGIVGRSLNQGFSGGEKKKAEILQLAVMSPNVAILDEPDSGLDIDAIKVVAENINEIAAKHKMSLLIITHYSRILSYMKPQFVHVMSEGKIVAEGSTDLIEKLEKEGYESFTKKV
ncbi:MAG: Fe-S cluster assembly ATPase SufC [Candidatus Micrarchaeota archaeon]|nr:Fe-S cluster assembly ATPase SufC [Candidatus Micrarchaeota archaeon]